MQNQRLEADGHHPVNFAFTKEKGGPSSDGEPDPKILSFLNAFEGPTLDLGSGDGRYTNYLLQRGVPIVAADLNSDALRTMRNFRAPDERVLGSIVVNAFKPLPFAGGSFTNVLSTALLHLRNPGEIRDSLEEMHRVTRPDGLLAVDLSTDINRFYLEGPRKGEPARGYSEVQYSFTEGHVALSSALAGLFEVQRLNFSDMDLRLRTQDGTVRLTTKKINVLARRR